MTDAPSTPAPAEVFAEQVVWITGASSGIGAALAVEFAAAGARLVLSARRRDRLESVRQQCIEAGAFPNDVLVQPLDVAAAEAMPAAVDGVLAHFGQIDLLINNAGISQRSICLDTDLDVYRRLFEVDVLGQIALTKQVLPHMVARGQGRIAVTASVAGKVGAPLRTGYCAVKHAVMGFFDALRTEVAHLGVKVTTIVPGYIRTDIARQALTGSGAEAGDVEDDVDNGMDVVECARVILQGFCNGTEEIEVGNGPEMGLLELKRKDPLATFRVLEGMATEVLARSRP
ncbi:MAG: SDR family oxidoreductase [Halieaceae bacterium]|uniref:SDR family oxidoreductase n=1 Tax=Haliea alexandrii TaxID=2448162 RepID=UPI000F0B7CEC|nr:SDR family oxidoreductase [Haliea alexandrii]MCR9185138.1 SDR family oxidoreductase [Halieaceae bacterium]